jgi:hypothetical protein
MSYDINCDNIIVVTTTNSVLFRFTKLYKSRLSKCTSKHLLLFQIESPTNFSAKKTFGTMLIVAIVAPLVCVSLLCGAIVAVIIIRKRKSILMCWCCVNLLIVVVAFVEENPNNEPEETAVDMASTRASDVYGPLPQANNNNNNNNSNNSNIAQSSEHPTYTRPGAQFESARFESARYDSIDVPLDDADSTMYLPFDPTSIQDLSTSQRYTELPPEHDNAADDDTSHYTSWRGHESQTPAHYNQS